MSRRYETACFFCDYWWVFLILLIAAVGIALTRGLWGPALFPATPTPIPPTPVNTAPSAAVTPGTGDVQVTLKWAGLNDLDLHVTDPSGEEIYYSHSGSESGGVLDIDGNAACVGHVTQTPIENIYWPYGEAQTGNYQISVVYYKICTDQAVTPFTVRVLVDGQVKVFTGQVSSRGEMAPVYEFTR